MTPALTSALALFCASVVLLFIATITRGRAAHWRTRLDCGFSPVSTFGRAARLAANYQFVSDVAFSLAIGTFCAMAGFSVGFNAGAAS